MKRILLITILGILFLSPMDSMAQLKKNAETPDFTGILTAPSNDVLFGFLDPSKMHMRHSFSMSYGAMGSHGMMLGAYLNTIDYQISEKLFLRTNIGVMSSPYNTYGEEFYLNKPQLFGGAMLKYQIDDDSSVMLRFDTAPGHYYYRPGYRNTMFNSFDRFSD